MSVAIPIEQFADELAILDVPEFSLLASSLPTRQCEFKQAIV